MAGQGRKELRKMRFAVQTTPNDAVATQPTVVWRGIAGMISDDREVVQSEEEIGVFGGGQRSYIPKLMGALSVPETEYTFEQGDWALLAAGLFPNHGTAVGSLVGSVYGLTGSTVVQELIVPTTAAPRTYSYAIVSGDNVEAETMGYTLATSVEFMFPAGEAVKQSSEYMGAYGTRANASGTFAGADVLVNVENVLASRGTVRWAFGGTNFAQVPAGNILGGKLSLEPMYEAKFSIDSGSIHFHTAVFTGINITGELTWEHQADGSYSIAGTAGMHERFRTQESMAIWMEFPGGTITDGTVFENKTFRVILPIRLTTISPLDDQNGNNIRTAEFTSKYDATIPSLGRGTFLIARRGTFEHGQAV